MLLDASEIAELRRIEEALWRPQTRSDRAFMDRICAPDFVEFGRSGRVYVAPRNSGDARAPDAG